MKIIPKPPTPTLNHNKIAPLPPLPVTPSLPNQKEQLAPPNQSQVTCAQMGCSSKQFGRYCPICQCFRENCDMVVFGACLHLFCFSCIQYFLELRMKQQLPLRCCQQNCQYLLSTDNQLSPQGNIAYINKISKETKQQITKYITNITRTRCQNCTFSPTKPTKIISACAQCKSLRMSLPPSHIECPSCQMVLFKDVGCDHLTCPCKYQFCFACGQEWVINHICQEKIPKRQGCAYLTCFLIKIPVYIVLGALLLGIFIIFAALLCVLSGGFMGFVVYFRGLDKLAKTDISGVGKFILFLLSILVLPILWVVLLIPGMLVPLINICHNQTIILHHNMLHQLFLHFLGCLQLLQLC